MRQLKNYIDETRDYSLAELETIKKSFKYFFSLKAFSSKQWGVAFGLKRKGVDVFTELLEVKAEYDYTHHDAGEMQTRGIH